MGRVDAAVEESSRRSTVPPGELADLAAAIERIESLIVEGAAQGPQGSAAVERIADIAFALHEREVESSLGDELNAAVREINDVGALKQVSAERTQEAAELLRQLSRRVHDMIAQSKADHGAAPAWKKNKFVITEEDDEEDDAPSNGSFKTDVPEDDEFALVVAALTAALPSLAEFGAPVPVPPGALARDAAAPIDDVLLPELSMEAADEAKTVESEPALPPAQDSGETATVIDSSSGILPDDAVLPPTPSNKEETSSEGLSAGEPPDGGLSDTLLEDLLRAAAASEHPPSEPPAEAVAELPPELDVPAEDLAPEAVLALPPPPQAPDESADEAIAAELSADLAEQLADHGDEARLPRKTEEQKAAEVDVPVVAESAAPSNKEPSSPSPLLAPDQDPGDLFDETPPVPNVVASKPDPVVTPPETTPEPARAVESPLATPMPLDPKQQTPASPPPQPRVATGAPTQPVSRPASNDPLGPVRALSEEETIALFS
jgi:hypothetical protein